MKKINLKEFPDFINDYWFHLTLVKAKSERTAEGYLIDIRVFFRYLIYMNSSEDIDFNKIDIQNFDLKVLENVNLHKIYEYIYFLRDERKNNDKTIARKISSIKSLFKYLTKQACILKNDPTVNLELPSLKKSLPKYLTLEESQELLENAANNKFNSLRDYCMITLFLNCGMRLSELVGINISDINFKERKIKLLGKGNKERMIYLNDACIQSLQDYIESRENSILEPDALFLSKKDGKYGFVDKNGNVVVEYIYDDAKEQNSSGFAAVKKDGKWGSINSKGNVVIEPTYNLDNYLVIDFIGKWHLGQDMNLNYYIQ